MIKTIKIIILIITLIFTSTLFSFDYDEIKKSFDNINYSRTIELTDVLSIENSSHLAENYEETLLYRAISFFHLKKYSQAKKLLKQFANKFPYSKNKDYSSYYLAFIDLQNENLVDAAIKFDNLSSSSNREIAEVSETILGKIVNSLISEEENYELSEKIWDKKILETLSKKRDIIDILVVLPLTGSKSKNANYILNGIKYFLDINKFPGNKNVKLEVVDSESNVPVMVKKVLDKLNTNNFDLIIGEYSRNSTSALSAIATLKKIPLIAPTASENDISNISKYIYQLTPSAYTLGQKIAEYAIDSLDYKIFSTIAPVTLEGKESIDGFKNMVEKKGCLVFSSEYYYKALNINKQLTRIREQVLNIDSLDLELYMSADSLKKGTPAGIIEAFFLPIKTKEIVSIAPQIAFYNFEAKLLGSQNWNDIKELNKVKTNINDIHFVKPNSNDASNSLYNDFAYKFRIKNKRNADKLEILGYDAMYFLYIGIKNSLKDNLALIDALNNLKKYSGINGTVLFEKGNRSNSSVEILKFNTKNKIPKKISLIGSKKSRSKNEDRLNKSYNIGYVNYQIKEYEKSLESFLKIKNENFELTNLYLANNYFYLNDYENAEIYYEKAVVTSSQNPDIYYNMALIKYSLDNEYDNIKAQSFMEKAADLGKKEAIIFIEKLNDE